jgi:hypothetical protein
MIFWAYKDVWNLANKGKGVKERFAIVGFIDLQGSFDLSQHSKGF